MKSIVALPTVDRPERLYETYSRILSWTPGVLAVWDAILRWQKLQTESVHVQGKSITVTLAGIDRDRAARIREAIENRGFRCSTTTVFRMGRGRQLRFAFTTPLHDEVSVVAR